MLQQHVPAETCDLGPDHPDTFASRNNLASALQDLGRHQEAANLHRQTLAHCERILGPDHPDHPDTLTSRNNLAAARATSIRATGTRGWWRRRARVVR